MANKTSKSASLNLEDEDQDILSMPILEEMAVEEDEKEDDKKPEEKKRKKEFEPYVIAENNDLAVRVKGPHKDPEIINDPDLIIDENYDDDGNLINYLGSPLKNDRLLDSIKERRKHISILNNVLEEMAEEAAYLKAWRNENWDSQKDMSDQSFKRIKVLRNLVETLMEKEKLKESKSAGKIDFYSENFQKVLQHFLQVIQETFKKVKIPEQFENIFFSQLAKDFDGFEKKAEKIYYGKKR